MDDLAEVAAAKQAMRIMWVRLLCLTREDSRLSKDDVDEFSKGFREVEAGLRVTEKHMLELIQDNGAGTS